MASLTHEPLMIKGNDDDAGLTKEDDHNAVGQSHYDAFYSSPVGPFV